jgi:hypothetical protein
MRQRDRRLAGRGPGPKGSPLRAIVRRWTNGGMDFRYAELECGHQLRVTGGYAWADGVRVPCGECPRKKRKRKR